MTGDDVVNGTTEIYVMGLSADGCMITYPGLRYSGSAIEAACARQSAANGKPAEPKTADFFTDLKSELDEWKGTIISSKLIRARANSDCQVCGVSI